MTEPRRPVIRGARFFLAHAPGLVRHGSKPSRDIAREASVQDAIRAAPFHLDAVKAGVAADVQHRGAAQIGRQGAFKLRPFHSRIVAQEVIWRGLDIAEPKVVEPRTQCANRRLNIRMFGEM